MSPKGGRARGFEASPEPGVPLTESP